ncbi:trichoplein keratin filament-binding protein isoform X1 [Ornithorhynchus anatinus]|uniref:trichoplein keratin filament-binding protein isoform X1 n=1 Tax=Ornithorhynchus anatinus TaxID=9258 RepID=UPI0000EDDBEE|nr:trichoplein keratin filament-binding protein isoform X1 [Ornithorhynchus anatinus]XP_028905304.1 trichoplein keratin filament-binding protein isoform X1 [Ornithorhynchus anatinus]
MALPTLPFCWENHGRALQRQILRRRDQEACFRRQWDANSRYFRVSDIFSTKQAQWSSRRSYQQSMDAYHRQKLKAEEMKNLEDRRERLHKLLLQEQELLTEEMKELRLNLESREHQIRERSENLKSAREERRKMVADQLLYEHWKKNNPKLREIEADLHKKHIISSWGDQVEGKKQQEASEKEENRRFENEYEASRAEALKRMKAEEAQRRAEDQLLAEALRDQMEELKLREMEAMKLKKEQENLLSQQWELESLEENRRQMEEYRKNVEHGRYLRRQFSAQLSRHSQQIQDELETDKRILQALLDKEDEEQRLLSARRERAAADVAWMKQVVEEQLQLEREREAELQTLYLEDSKQMWQKREEEWAQERQARDKLMNEVLAGRQLQIQEKLEKNRRAQEESLKCREQLLRDLEEAKELTWREKEEAAELKTARKQELEAQVAERNRQKQEASLQQQHQEEQARLAQHQEDEVLQQEAKALSDRGYQPKHYGRPKTAWS